MSASPLLAAPAREWPLAENTAPAQGKPQRGRPRGRPFVKGGPSANPGGRPKRIREIEDAIAREATPERVVAILKRLEALALAGDTAAIKLYLERVIGPPRPMPEEAEEARDELRRIVAGALAEQGGERAAEIAETMIATDEKLRLEIAARALSPRSASGAMDRAGIESTGGKR